MTHHKLNYLLKALLLLCNGWVERLGGLCNHCQHRPRQAQDSVKTREGGRSCCLVDIHSDHFNPPIRFEFDICYHLSSPFINKFTKSPKPHICFIAMHCWTRHSTDVVYKIPSFASRPVQNIFSLFDVMLCFEFLPFL